MVCQCICQICICGKHQCPVHGRSSLCIMKGETCKVTEYSNRYKVHEICPAKLCKPPQCVPESGEFCGQTTTKTDYKAHGDARRDLIKYNDTLKPKGDIDSTTMYRKEFPAKELCKSQSCKPVLGYCPPESALSADTTNRSDFKAWPQDRRALCKREDIYSPPEGKMSSDTTNKSAYKIPEMCRVRSCKPTDLPIQSGCFNPLTENKATYVAHPVSKPESCKPIEEYKPGGDFDALTTNRKDYTNKPVCRTQSCKPEVTCIQSDVPMCANTETRDNYKAQQGGRPDLIIPGDNLMNKGDMEKVTTSRRDYAYQGGCKAESAKPIECANLSDVPFDAISTSRTDFKSWDVPRRGNCAPLAEYKPSEAPFDDATAYKSNYVAHQMCKPKSCKPEVCLERSCDFKGESEYKNSYNYKQSDCCPVLNLAGLGYEFVQQTNDGHQVFTKFCPDPSCPQQKQHNEDFAKKPL